MKDIFEACVRNEDTSLLNPSTLAIERITSLLNLPAFSINHKQLLTHALLIGSLACSLVTTDSLITHK